MLEGEKKRKEGYWGKIAYSYIQNSLLLYISYFC